MSSTVATKVIYQSASPFGEATHDDLYRLVHTGRYHFEQSSRPTLQYSVQPADTHARRSQTKCGVSPLACPLRQEFLRSSRNAVAFPRRRAHAPAGICSQVEVIDTHLCNAQADRRSVGNLIRPFQAGPDFPPEKTCRTSLRGRIYWRSVRQSMPRLYTSSRSNNGSACPHCALAVITPLPIGLCDSQRSACGTTSRIHASAAPDAMFS